MPPATVTPAAPPAPTTETKEYVIASGDTLGAIAHKNGITLKAMMDANPGVNPKKLKVGQKVQIPAGASSVASAASPGAATPDMAAASGDTTTYTVKSGDTLSKIAKLNHTSFKKIMAMNDLKTTSIKVGQKLKLPVKAAGTETPAAPASAAVVPLQPAPRPRLRRRRLPPPRRINRNKLWTPGSSAWRPFPFDATMKWATTILIFCVAVLVGLGLVMLYSASMNMEMGKSAVGADYLLSQLVWLTFGLIGCVVAARIDYRRWKKVSPYLLVVSVILLLLVFAPVIGIGRKGAHRWIGLPGLPHFQPSELARLSLILFLAAYGEWFQRQMAGFRQGLLIPGCIIAVVLALIFIEPDRGCAILLALVAGTVLIVAGVRLRFLLLPALGAVGGPWLVPLA